MPLPSSEHIFLQKLDEQLWGSAQKLRQSLDAANYKHVVLTLIFIKFLCDQKDRLSFYLPDTLTWDNLKKYSHQELDDTFTVSVFLDVLLDQLEEKNPALKGVLNRFQTFEVTNSTLKGLINLFDEIDFNSFNNGIDAKDLLGHIYEYFLGEFAIAEGKQGGQYYTPKGVVSLIVEILKPLKGSIYDPAMGSGGFFISSDKFLAENNLSKEIKVFGQESNSTTRKLAIMNMLLHDLSFNFGESAGDTLKNDHFRDVKFNYIMANPPFNLKDWWSPTLSDDPRWKYAVPPKGNANYAWISHILSHLDDDGKAAIVLSNGTMTGTSKEEFAIRYGLINDNFLDCIISLPTQLFKNTQIGACIWILNKKKTRSETLFINAKDLGRMESKVFRTLDPEDISLVAETYWNWVSNSDYNNIPGFCRSATPEDLEFHKYALVPGRYVGFNVKEVISENAINLMFERLNRVQGKLDQVISMCHDTKNVLGEIKNG